jgi:hypothetical protein
MAFKIKLEPIKPDKPLFQRGPIEDKIEQALTLVAADIQIDLITSVEDWKTPVQFVIKRIKKMQREIYTESAIFGYVNKGGPAHLIYPKAGRGPKARLVFNVGGITIYARVVRHPGTKAKNITEHVAADWRFRVVPMIQKFLVNIS